MHTVAFHEIKKSNLELARRVGLKRTSRGDKGDDKEIIKTDKLLDDNRQAELVLANVSRDDCLYCYFYYKNKIVDITDGKLKDIHEISRSKSQALLRVKVIPTRCYVSNLDLYDEILQSLKRQNTTKAIELANKYWQKLTRLDNYDHSNGFKRPEIMVTYDVPPSCLEVVKS
jgi:hypothetical protein